MKVGDYHWRVEGATLTVERTRDSRAVGMGIFYLLWAAGLAYYTWGEAEEELDAVYTGVMALMAFVGGLYNLLWLWRVVMRRESKRVDTMWGLGVPLMRKRRGLASFDRVQFETLAYRPRKESHCVVRLAGPSTSLLLTKGGDEDEAKALAETVSREFGLLLQIDEGRARPVDGSQVPSSPLPGVDASKVPAVPPPGSRVRVEQVAALRVLELPAAGWTGRSVAWSGIGSVLVLAGLFFCIYPFLKWYEPSFTGENVARVVLSLSISAMGLFIVKRTRSAMASGWKLTVSRKGLEVAALRPGNERPMRIPMQQIRDVDVRKLAYAGEQANIYSKYSGHMLLIDREGENVQVGAGLPREELEWAADWVRAALAEAQQTAR